MLHSYVTLGPIYQAILLNALKINTILQTYPLNGTWRQHLAVTTDTKTGEDCTVVCHPTLEGLVIHSGGFGKLVFVGGFHGCVGVLYCPTKVRHFYDIHKKCHDKFPLIFWTYLDLSGHIWTKVDNGSGNCRTFASSIRNDMQTGQDLLLGGGVIATRRSSRKQTPTPFRAGVKAKPKTKHKTRPKPGNGRA